MGLVIEVMAASEGDVLELAAHMRDADRAEVRAASGQSPETVVRESVANSAEARSVRANGELCCIYGVVPLHVFDLMYGIPWMLATERIHQWPTHIMRMGREAVTRWMEDYEGLVNFVHARNDMSVRWLERLGFELEDPEPYGAAGEPFRRFSMMKEEFAHV
jgi:hypothetical protein